MERETQSFHHRKNRAFRPSHTGEAFAAIPADRRIAERIAISPLHAAPSPRKFARSTNAKGVWSMSDHYTVAVRERGKMQAYKYIGVDGCVHATTTYSKPLTLADAKLARRLLMEGAAKVDRPIDCRIVTLKEIGA
jgi:hypothetical protein